MVKKCICLLAMAIFAAPLYSQEADSPTDRQLLEQILNEFVSMRKTVNQHSSDIAAIRADVAEMRSERLAAKTFTVPPLTFAPAPVQQRSSTLMMSSSYSTGMSGMTQSGGVRRGIFARRGGGCGAGG